MQSQNKMFAHYQVLEKIGQGGMGVVYKVFDTKLQRIVALKVMIQHPDNKVQSQRFIDEVKTVATLSHNHIVRLFEAGTSPSYYFTMEYIEGETLDKLIETLPTNDIVAIFKKVADALYHAHCKGFVHRDVKPGNILINKALEPKVTDFGLVKNMRIDRSLSKTGEIIGTPKYVSPEQVLTGNIDKRSDIFSLGITMYEALAKQYPFRYEEQNMCATLLYKIIHNDPAMLSQVNKDINNNLSIICHTCIYKDPKKRYQNMKMLSRDLESYLNGQPIKASTDSFLFLVYNTIKRNAIVVLLTALLSLLLVLRFVFLPSNIEPQKVEKVLLSYPLELEVPIIKTQLNIESYEEKVNESLLEKAELYYSKSLLGNYDIEKIIEVYNEIQQQNPNDLNAHQKKVYMYIINGDLENGYWERQEIVDVYKLVTDKVGIENLNNEDIATFNQISVYVLFQKKYPNEKFTFTPAHNAFGYWFYSMVVEDHWEKEKYLLKALALQKEVRFFNDLALLYDQNDLPEETLAICLHGLKYFPSTVLLHYFAARAYIGYQNYNQAQNHVNFVVKHYYGKFKYKIYYEQVRLYVLTNKIKEARETLQFIKTILPFDSRLHTLWQIWNELIDAIQYKTYSPQIENSLPNLLFRVRLFKELNMFHLIHQEVGKITPSTDVNLKKEILLAYVAELEHLDFATSDQYVVNLWIETYEEILQEITKQLRKNFSYFWYRKLVYLVSNATECDALKEYNISWREKDILLDYLADDVKHHYFYHKNMGDLAYSYQTYSLAAQCYERAMDLAPWYSELEDWRDFSLAKHLYYERGQKVSAHNIVNKILIRNSLFAPAYILQGSFYNVNNNDHNTSQEFFQKARNSFFMKIRDRKDLHYDSGSMHQMSGKHQEAIELFSKYIILAPSHPFGFLSRGRSYQAIEEYQKALVDFNNMVLLDENRDNPNKIYDYIHSYQVRAVLYEEWGNKTQNLEEKRALYQKALDDWTACFPVVNFFKEKQDAIVRLQTKLQVK